MATYSLYGLAVLAHSTTLSICLIIFIVVYIVLKFGRQEKRHPPGPWGLPVVGHLPFLGQNPPYILAKWRKLYGSVFQIRLGVWDTVVINGYNAIKEAADRPEDNFSSRPPFMFQKIFSKTASDAILSFRPFDQDYLYQRKLTVTALRGCTFRSKKRTHDIISAEANILADRLISESNTKEKCIHEYVQNAIVSSIFPILFGVREHRDSIDDFKTIIDALDKFIDFAKAGNVIEMLPWLRYILPWRLTQIIDSINKLDEIVKTQIYNHLDTFATGNIRDNTDASIADITGKFCIESVSKDLLIGTLRDLLGAGYETTYSTTLWLIQYMASYPDVQTHVQQEIDEVIGRGRLFEITDRDKLVFTEATLLEVMRLTTILPLGLPRFTTKHTTLDGFDIKKDTIVYFNLQSVSHDTDFWGDPEVFRPSRFLLADGRLDKVKCSHVIPFGLGRRRCPGENLAKMQAITFFVTIMQRCSIEKPEGVTYDLEPVIGLVYKPKYFKVIVRKR